MIYYYTYFLAAIRETAAARSLLLLSVIAAWASPSPSELSVERRLELPIGEVGDKLPIEAISLSSSKM